MAKHLINHHFLSNYYLIVIMPGEKPVFFFFFFFFKFSIKLLKCIGQNDNIRTALNWTLLWRLAMSLNRQMLTRIFISNKSEKGSMVAEMLQKHIFIFNNFLSKNYVYLYSIKKIFLLCKNFVIQRKYIYTQSKYTSI